VVRREDSAANASLESRPKTDAHGAKDPVQCTVFAPLAALPREVLMVQVFAHQREQAKATKKLAKQFDKAAEIRAVKSLEATIPRGTLLSFHLAMPGVKIDSPVQHLIWQGQPESVQFGVSVPPRPKAGAVLGTVTVSHNSVPVGHIKFKLTIQAKATTAPRPVPRGESARWYRKAFVSYASPDRVEVLKRVQILRQLSIEVFQDILVLEPGDRWERELYRHIDTSDLFLLFWSSAARQSQWVRKEIRYAIRRKKDDESAPPEIVPVILEGPPPPEPPDELAHLHFNDYLVYLINQPKNPV